MADGKITGPDLIADDVFARIAKLDTQLAGLVVQLGNIETAAKGALNTSQLNQQAERANRTNREALDIIREQDRLEKALIRTKQRNELATEGTARALARERVELQAQNREVSRQVTANSELVGAYRRLSAQLNIAKDRYKDLAIEQGTGSLAARRQAQEVAKLQARIRSADQAVGDFQRNVGNYRSALGGLTGVFRGLIGAFGAIEGIRLGARFIGDAQRLAREAKGVEFAFNRLGDSGEEAFNKVRAATQGLISNLEIKRSLVEFDNFNISLEESATLFEFLAVRAAQTGRSVDYLRTSLVEGLSKESKLRIDNLGISALELNEELGKTPNFVQAVANIAKREIAEAGDIIDDAANSMAKFNAATENLQVSIGEIANEFGLLGVATTGINLLDQQINQITRAASAQLSVFEQIAVLTRTSTIGGRLFNEQLLAEAEYRKRLVEEIDAQAAAYVRLNGSLAPFQQGQGGDDQTPFPFRVTDNQAAARSIADINKEIEELNQKLNNQTTREGAKAIQERIAALEKERDALLGIVEPTKAATKARQEFIDSFELDSEATITATIGYLEELKSQAVIGSEAYREYAEQIKNLRDRLEELQRGGVILDPAAIPNLDSIEDLDIAFEVDRFLNTEGIAAGMEDLAAKVKQPIEELYAEFQALYKQDYASFLEYSSKKIEASEIEKLRRLELADDILRGVNDIGQALFDAAEQRAQREVDRQNEVFDSIINSKNATEEQIAIAEAKREENEKKIAREREKREKKAFLLQQAVDVGRAIVQAQLASMAALAPPPIGLGPIAGKALIPFIQANLGIALATILAQTLPAFFTGKGPMDNYEGMATWGERGREVRVTKEGRIELSPDTTTPTYVRRDDLILRNVPLFKQAMSDPNSEVFKRVAGAWKQDAAGRAQVAAPGGYNPAHLERSIQAGLRRGFKGVEHRINIINKLDPQPRVRRY